MATAEDRLMTFVLDTSFFTDPRLRGLTGSDSLRGVVEGLSRLLGAYRVEAGPLFYTTPSVYRETRRFLLSNGVPPETLEGLEVWLVVKSPDRHGLRIPGAVMVEYVEELRRRLDKALRISEEAARRAAEGGRESLPEVVRYLRERFREGVRKGIVDSPEDVELVLLGLELKAVVVSNDEGIERLAHSLGLITLNPPQLVSYLLRMAPALGVDTGLEGMRTRR